MNRHPESAKDRLARTLYRSLKATMHLASSEGSPLSSMEEILCWIDHSLAEMDQEMAIVLLPLLLDRLQNLVEEGGRRG